MPHHTEPIPPVDNNGIHTLPEGKTYRDIGQHTSWCDADLKPRPAATVHGYTIEVVGCNCGGHFHGFHKPTGLLGCMTTAWVGDYRPSVVQIGMKQSLAQWVDQNVTPTVSRSVTDLAAQDATAAATPTFLPNGTIRPVPVRKERLN